MSPVYPLYRKLPVLRLCLALAYAGTCAPQNLHAQPTQAIPSAPLATVHTTTPAAPAPTIAVAAATPSTQQQIAPLQAQINNAVARVQQIVNQPVRRLQLTRAMRYSNYREGWFHPGANTPDFNHIDIRTTQEKPYDNQQYVTSPLNPGIVFYGPDLEFNANTKYFVTDRNTPKKKLTDGEMVEINSLYRIIGKCQDEIARLSKPPAGTAGQPPAGGKPALAALQKETPVPEEPDPTPPKPAPAKGIDPATGHILVGCLGAVLAVLTIRRFTK